MTLYDPPLPATRLGRRPRAARRVLVAALALALTAGLVWEARTFRGQAWLFSRIAARLDTTLGAGPAPPLHLARSGPYDERLGYSRLPEALERLRQDGWRVVAQARLSPLHDRLVRLGMAPIYREKTQAGLEILDPNGSLLYAVRYPHRVYRDFEAVPSLVAQTLTFIENRELLDPVHVFRNPAVEWDRLATAVAGRGVRLVRPDWKSHGGSTLATQLEKSRHSPGGRTSSGAEKARQMSTASLRAYRLGAITETARRSTLVEYLNALPLAALPGFGEVHGLGDGLWAWYGTDFARANAAVAGRGTGAEASPRAEGAAIGEEAAIGAEEAAIGPEEAAIAYRQMLSLLLAQRRPGYYLVEDPAALDPLTDRYLEMLDAEGVLPRGFATAPRTALRTAAPARERSPLTARKADLAVRSRVAQLVGVDRLYDLDRLDLTVATTLDAETQNAVTDALLRLADKKGAREAGVATLLGGDPAGVLYSFTLYERSGGANAVRVQVDSGDRPLDLNDGAKLELGSTAKLRTLVHYLELVAELHDRYAALSRAEIERLRDQAPDKLTRFVLEHLATTRDADLDATLEAAMLRQYSASPWEGFFTGGGLHHFQNFDAADNGRVVSVRQGFHRSVNLVFIRLMRDLVEHYRARVPAQAASILEDADHPLRAAYLERFADREGAEFLRRYHREYAGLSSEQAFDKLAARLRPTPKRLVAAFRSVRPDAPFEELDVFLRERLPLGAVDEGVARKLYDQLSEQRLTLGDRGHVARVHPLELWTVEYLSRQPGASLGDVLAASASERQDAYAWLRRTSHKSAQDRRIRTLLEAEAFVEIHRAWQRVGYPFDALVPSYATAIGSSADRPSALAELLGILVNDGVRRSTERLSRLHFGASTPFETVLEREPSAGERVLHAEVAAVARRELLGVVRSGTAARARKTVELADGSTLEVGGKTGTGDNRKKRAGVKASRAGVMNRTATFVFTVGDRFYGTVLVYVPGEAAADYGFTSSAAVQVWNHLLPALRPLFDRPPLESEWTLFAGAAGRPGIAGPLDHTVTTPTAATLAPARAARRARELVALAALPVVRTPPRLDVDRVVPDGAAPEWRGFYFPDPRWRQARAAQDVRGVLAHPSSLAVLPGLGPRLRLARATRRRGGGAPRNRSARRTPAAGDEGQDWRVQSSVGEPRGPPVGQKRPRAAVVPTSSTLVSRRALSRMAAPPRIQFPRRRTLCPPARRSVHG